MIHVSQLAKHYRLYRRPADRLLDWLRIPSRAPRCEEFPALENIDFQVSPGECLGIIGANGAGKSTLLRILGGITTPSWGECRIHGRVSSLLDLGLGFHQDLTGRENILLSARFLGLENRQVEERLQQMIDFVELGSFIDRPVRTYSSGMFVRLGFAAAAGIDPDVLIVDEVLSVGDLYFQRKSLQRMEHFKALGKSIVMASHSMPIIQRFCDRTLWLHRGKIQGYGDTREVIRDYEQFSLRQDALNPDPGPPNAAENPQTGEPASTVPQRVGTGEIDIREVRMMDRDGRCRWQYEPSEALTIEMDCIFHRQVENPIFVMLIHDIDGKILFASANYSVDPADLGTLDGLCRIRYDLQALHLSKGSYFLSVGAFLEPDHPFWSRPSHYHNQEYEFKVWSEKIEHGPLDMVGSWHANPIGGNAHP